jgi:hypothetical protein
LKACTLPDQQLYRTDDGFEIGSFHIVWPESFVRLFADDTHRCLCHGAEYEQGEKIGTKEGKSIALPPPYPSPSWLIHQQ